MGAVGRGKGTLLVNLRRYIVEKEGEAHWTRLLTGLQPPDRAVLDSLLLVGGWYPVGVWNRTLAAFVGPAKDPSKLTMEIARYIADKDLNTIFKALMRFGSPEFLLSRTDSLWTRYFDVGTMTNQEVSKKKWALRLTAPTGADAAPDERTCNEGVLGWVGQALELTGAKNHKVVHTRCRHHHHNTCDYEVTW